MADEAGGGPTHATLATFRMDPGRVEMQQQLLRDVIVPGVRSAPGFVSGHWTLDAERSESNVLVTFDSADAAEAMAANIRANAENQAAAGVELVDVRFVEVLASA